MPNSISRRRFMKTTAAASVMGALSQVLHAPRAGAASLPNVVLIYTDDQGYADTGRFGAKDFKTPNLDKMADDGIRFTDFYVAQPVCGASRAGLLTGCYPNRIGMYGAPSHKATHGINDNEMTMAELFKQKDYATAIFGKWHLGHHTKFLPTHHGFDEYLGLPYSNDMWPFHPENPNAYPPLPLIEGDRVVRYNPDQSHLTTWYTERAVNFIKRNQDNPFFLYVPHNMPHVPLFVSDKFKGTSKQGMYGDVIQEVDWSVGQILKALHDSGLEDNTLVIFASDNGPWLSYGDHAGSAGPLREGKGTVWDGGTRVPCIMRWPGKIAPGSVCREPAMTIDLFPTFAKMIGAKLPDHTIDGLDIMPLILNQPGAKGPHEAYFFYWNRGLEAVRSGKWSLHFPHAYRTMGNNPPGHGGIPGKYMQARTELALFDLENDIGQHKNVVNEHPDVVKRLEKLADGIREELGDGKIQGKGVREPGRL